MPPTIWTAAADGTLTKGSLLDFLDKDPTLLDQEDKSGITPLGYALIKGRATVVGLLLENQANPDKVMGEKMPYPDRKTPVYVAATAKKSSARTKQLLLKKNPKSFDQPMIPALKDETPLTAAVRTQNVEVVKMLIEQGASVDKRRNDGKSTIDLAKELPDGSKKTAIQAALQPNLKGAGGLRSYVKNWAVRVLGRFKIFKPLGNILKGATRYFNKIAPPTGPDQDYYSEIKDPETVADFKENLNAAVDSGGLQKFFPPGDPYIDEVAKKAAGLKKDPNNLLNDPSQIQGLATLALYQAVLYCDDSYSMHEEDRWPKQTELATRIADIAIQSVPNFKGVHFRFINRWTDTNDLNGAGVGAQLAANIGGNIRTLITVGIYKPLN